MKKLFAMIAVAMLVGFAPGVWAQEAEDAPVDSLDWGDNLDEYHGECVFKQSPGGSPAGYISDWFEDTIPETNYPYVHLGAKCLVGETSEEYYGYAYARVEEEDMHQVWETNTGGKVVHDSVYNHTGFDGLNFRIYCMIHSRVQGDMAGAHICWSTSVIYTCDWCDK